MRNTSHPSVRVQKSAVNKPLVAWRGLTRGLWTAGCDLVTALGRSDFVRSFGQVTKTTQACMFYTSITHIL